MEQEHPDLVSMGDAERGGVAELNDTIPSHIYLAAAAPGPLDEHQYAVITQLTTQNRQLDAFRKALKFTISGATLQLPRLLFSARVVLFWGGQGDGYPTVDLTVPLQHDHDANYKSCLACYLLIRMLKCYRGLQFPDRVDFRDGGVNRGTLLFPYRTTQEGHAVQEAVRVRQLIVMELAHQ